MATSQEQGGQDQVSQGMESLAGKYLTFQLEQEEYGIPILAVVEIIKMMEITPVPRTPTYVRGVVNLRGKVIPVIELREKFGMPGAEDTDETCIVVVTLNTGDAKIQMGIIIDRVSEVLDIKTSQLEPSPSFGTACDTEFILAMAKAADSVKMLIDINRVLSEEDVNAMTSMAKQ